MIARLLAGALLLSAGLARGAPPSARTAPRAEGPTWVTLAPGRAVTFDQPLAPGRFQSFDGACALRDSGELTCVTSPRLARRPPRVSAVDGGPSWGNGVVPPGNVVSWGTVPLPHGPFKAVSSSSSGDGCAIDLHDHLACWGDASRIRDFGRQLAGKAVRAVAVGPLRACAILADGALVCLHGPIGFREGPPLVHHAGTWRAVSLQGFNWAVTTDGMAVGGGVDGTFTEAPARVPGAFAHVVSDGFVACGLEKGRVRCFDGAKLVDAVHGVSVPTGTDVEQLTAVEGGFCIVASGRASCFGQASRMPGGELAPTPARAAGALAGLLCIIDPDGALRCRSGP